MFLIEAQTVWYCKSGKDLPIPCNDASTLIIIIQYFSNIGGDVWYWTVYLFCNAFSAFVTEQWIFKSWLPAQKDHCILKNTLDRYT